MFLSSCLLGVFYSCLVCVSFISSSIGYCLVLLVSVFSLVGFIYFGFGASWYLVLLCLVYVGGTYILLIYASLYNPSFYAWLSCSYYVFLGVFLFLFLLFESLVCFNVLDFWDCSHYLCSYQSGPDYCFFCVVLLLGFVLISEVCLGKDCFCR